MRASPGKKINTYVHGGEAVASSSTSNESDHKRQQVGEGKEGSSVCMTGGLFGRYNRRGVGDRGTRRGEKHDNNER